MLLPASDRWEEVIATQEEVIATQKIRNQNKELIELFCWLSPAEYDFGWHSDKDTKKFIAKLKGEKHEREEG